MDKNHDGFISKVEIKEYAEKLDATDNGNISMEGKKVLRNCT